MTKREVYIWERARWPRFTYDAQMLLVPLGAARRAQGEFHALIESLGFRDRDRAEIESRTEEAIRTAEIEGEPLSRVAVRSSIARRLHIDQGGLPPADAATEGLIDMILDATLSYAEPLTVARLHRWHTGLFPALRGARRTLTIGGWRTDETGPMQVVSGRIDAPTVHFEAPPAARIPRDLEAFLSWFESPREGDGLVTSAIAHLWFLTIHPYDDGNGRIARAIADMALARDEKSSRRFFSMSRQINVEKQRYYDMLERVQKGNLDITEWLVWFLESYGRAIGAAQSGATGALQARAFWRLHEDVQLSERQRAVLARYLNDFQGKLTTKKWSLLGKTSTDTAQRDINDLVEKGLLVKNLGGSKNTSYSLAGYEPPHPSSP